MDGEPTYAQGNSNAVRVKSTMNIDIKMKLDVAGVTVPDSKLAREIAELARDTETPLLFHHSSRVYYWGALAGRRHGLIFDPELLYAGAMFHDMGLSQKQRIRLARVNLPS
jgi:hypothetical protein